MIWKPARDVHTVYEALSAIADGRFVLSNETTAQCSSSSKNKFYTIEFDETTNSIISNDNMAYYVGEVSYPMVAMLLEKGVIKYNKDILVHLKNIKWKEINKKNKNDYMKSVREVLESLSLKGVDTNHIDTEANAIYSQLSKIELNRLSHKRTVLQDEQLTL
jgi:hypothetical protein